MEDVTVGSDTYSVYGTLAAANSYWNGRLGSVADAWSAATSDKRKRGLNSASLLIDRQQYIEDADTRGERDAITEIVQASYEIAGQLVLDPEFFNKLSSGNNVKRVSPGGGVEVEFFVSTQETAALFPPNIQDLIGPYLLGQTSIGVSGSFSSGTSTCDETHFGTDSEDSPFGVNRPI